MNEELDKILCEKYPKIFRDRSKSMQESCMHWGFEHGDGWYNIIEAACRNIQNHVDWKRKQEPYASMSHDEFDEIHQPIAAQVKEKFGTLRFYVDNSNREVSGAIVLAELMSGRTCEYSGSPGTPRRGGWVKTLCDACESNKTKRRTDG